MHVIEEYIWQMSIENLICLFVYFDSMKKLEI